MARKRNAVLGSYRDAYEKSDVSIGTWERLEKGGAVQKRSLWRAVDALGWPSSAATDLLEDRDPDRPKTESQDLFPGLYDERADLADQKKQRVLEAWPPRLVERLGYLGRYLTDIEKEQVVDEVHKIAGPREYEDRQRKKADREQFALAAEGGPTEEMDEPTTSHPGGSRSEP